LITDYQYSFFPRQSPLAKVFLAKSRKAVYWTLVQYRGSASISIQYSSAPGAASFIFIRVFCEEIFAAQAQHAATLQPKSQQAAHHEGREEHEVKNLKRNNFRILRVLRALRGDMVFFAHCGLW